MEEKIFDLFNNAKVNFDEYKIEDLSMSEKKRLKKRVLEEVSPMKKQKNKTNLGWKFAGVAAIACLAVSIVAVGNNSTAARELFSETFRKIISGTEGQKDGEELKEVYTKIGKEATPVKADTQASVLETEDAGVTMRVSDIYCDGYMMYYTLALETDNPILTGKEIDALSTEAGGDYIPACHVKIDGEEETGDILRFDKQADGTYTSVQNCDFYCRENLKKYQDGDVIPVEIDVSQIAGWDYDEHDKSGEYIHTEAVSGNWKLSFQATVDTSGNVTQKIGKEKNGVKIVKAVRTKAALNLEIELPDFSAEPFNDKYNDPDIAIWDENGKAMQWLGNYHQNAKNTGKSILYLTLLDDEGEDYKLEITNKNGDGRVFATINFKVKR